MYNFLVGTRRHFLKTDASSDHTGNGKQNYFRTGKGRARVAGGARARRCELRDGVAGRASLQHCFNRRPRDHGAQAVGGSAGGGNRGAAGKPRCATERNRGAGRGQPLKRAADRGRRAPAEGRSAGAPDRAYGTRAAPFTLGFGTPRRGYSTVIDSTCSGATAGAVPIDPVSAGACGAGRRVNQCPSLIAGASTKICIKVAAVSADAITIATTNPKGSRPISRGTTASIRGRGSRHFRPKSDAKQVVDLSRYFWSRRR
jgi:hypothetical protein